MYLIFTSSVFDMSKSIKPELPANISFLSYLAQEVTEFQTGKSLKPSFLRYLIYHQHFAPIYTSIFKGHPY